MRWRLWSQRNSVADLPRKPFPWKKLLADAGEYAGAAIVVWGLWGIYWPLAAIVGGGTLLAVCVMVQKAWDSSQR